MQLISIEHRTAYTFSQTVVLKPHRLLLRPRDGFDLRIRSSALSIEPKSNIHWARDGFGNSVAIATFGEKTEQLDILSSVIVEQYQQTTLDTTLLPNLSAGLDQGLEKNPNDSSPGLGLYQVATAPCTEGAQDKTTGIPNSVAVGTLLNFSILLLAKTTDTHKVPSSISVTASPKFKTPTSISPLIRLVLIGPTPL